MTMLKRSIEDREVESLAMANCLMLLSRVGGKTEKSLNRVFTCKTCDRKFPSFQALGGHRASHKKPRLMMTVDLNHQSTVTKQNKAHDCPICGQEFAIGQALGGHMRRHRAEKNEGPNKEMTEIVTPILKRSSSCSKRVVCLDLNLTPFENDVKLGIKSNNLPFWLMGFLKSNSLH